MNWMVVDIPNFMSKGLHLAWPVFLVAFSSIEPVTPPQGLLDIP